MSRGLSIYQKAILSAVEQYGFVDILKAAIIFSYTKQKAKGEANPTIWKFESVEDIRNPSRLYRMMRPLEDRGDVARLLHRRRAVWFKVVWVEGKPKPFDFEQEEIDRVIRRDGRLEFKTKGKYWGFQAVEPTQSQKKNQERQGKWARERMGNNEIKKRKTSEV